MAASNTSLLLVALLVSFCNESFEIRGWIEDRIPNAVRYRDLAEFAYVDQKGGSSRGLTCQVTQARWMYTEGVRHQIGFIVYHENTMREKCIATIQLPPPSRIQQGMTVTRFWCRRIPPV
uniref:Cystatin n=1 Tax=Rhipicephalus appendiculatus TaxID=34631 RepID=A0A131YAF8_RHIAP